MKRFVVVIILTLGLLIGVSLAVVKAVQNRRLVAELTENLKKADISVTIIEGKRREEIASQLAAAGITPYADFMTASKTAEGTLFPETYRFFPNTPAAEVVAKLTSTYTLRTKALAPTKDQLNLAAIVEREAENDSQRATIAGVYANRLRIGMAMEADPTVQYSKDTLAFVAAGSPKDYTFWAPITRADYRSISSPYNLYLTSGLTPTPICNPGIRSIEAAITPAEHSYFFFFNAGGKLYLSKTLAEHEQKLKSAR